MPFCLYEIFFIPEYWAPSTILDRHVGLEDVLFSFATGGIAWLVPALAMGGTITLTWHPRRFLRRFAGGAGLGITSSLILWGLGLSIMTAVLLCIGVGIVVLAWRFPRLHTLALAGAAGFGLLYSLVLASLFMLLPDFASQWTPSRLSDARLAGLPAEEILWACGFGAVWPRFVAYVFDARWSPNLGTPAA
jgi:hypothetical protein